MDLSDSGFIAPHTISTNWSDISLFQQRNYNMLYHAKRYGKYFVLNGLSVDCQSLTDYLLLQEKEFALGVSLNHPHIAETYSLEEVEGYGRCIVMDWAGEKGPDSKRKRIFSPTCSFENTTFFKDHGACINMIPCEFGAHGAEGEGRVSRVLK